MIIRFVVATQKSKAEFFAHTLLGKCLQLHVGLYELDLYDFNKDGLPKIYNNSIDSSKKSPAILVFIHDDVFITDFFWAEHIFSSLSKFDIIGVAGNKRRMPNQPSWAFTDYNYTWDSPENLSGVVGYGNNFIPTNISRFGPVGQEVKLLDGVFLACNSSFLNSKNLRFDERFDFLFYDLDFCREAEKVLAKMGTSSVSIIHESTGNFYTPQWFAAKDKYFEKWID